MVSKYPTCGLVIGLHRCPTSSSYKDPVMRKALPITTSACRHDFGTRARNACDHYIDCSAEPICRYIKNNTILLPKLYWMSCFTAEYRGLHHHLLCIPSMLKGEMYSKSWIELYTVTFSYYTAPCIEKSRQPMHKRWWRNIYDAVCEFNLCFIFYRHPRLAEGNEHQGNCVMLSQWEI